MNQHTFPDTAASLKTAGIVSSVLVLPFVIMESANTGDLSGGFPVALFAVLWVIPFAFIVIVMPIVRSLQTANRASLTPLRVLPRIVVLALFAWLWVSLVLDQMPCFLGVPNCD